MDSKVCSDREAAEAAAAAWLARRERDDWSESDQRELRAWIEVDFNHRAAWLRVDTAWRETERLKTLTTTATPGAVPTHDQMHIPFFASDRKSDMSAMHLSSPPLPLWERVGVRGSWAAAASLVVLIAATWYLSTLRASSYRTDIGALQAVPLPDGSRVTLNTSTELRIAVTKSERRIELKEGEAYFEVAKDPTRPFIVDAGDKRIVAVGTQFSVRREGGDVRVVVAEGAVQVEGPGSERKLPLSAGGIARADEQGVLVRREPLTEIEQLLSWRTGFLVFDQTPLAQAVAEFNRYNARQIAIEDPALAAILVGGNFRAANVEAFVRLIESELGVASERHGERILLKGAPPAEK